MRDMKPQADFKDVLPFKILAYVGMLSFGFSLYHDGQLSVFGFIASAFLFGAALFFITKRSSRTAVWEDPAKRITVIGLMICIVAGCLGISIWRKFDTDRSASEWWSIAATFSFLIAALGALVSSWGTPPKPTPPPSRLTRFVQRMVWRRSVLPRGDIPR